MRRCLFLIVAGVGVSAGFAGIAPLRIVPNKIVYDEGERGWFTATFTNREAKAGTAAVVVNERWGLGLAGERRELWRGEMKLAAGECGKLKIDYPGSDVRYGHEVSVETAAGSRSEYFAVNDKWWRCGFGCGLEPKGKTLTPLYRQFLEYYGLPVAPARSTGGMLVKDMWKDSVWDMGPFAGYSTLQTRWQMQKSSVGGNEAAAAMPDGVRWYTANGSSPRDSGAIREDSDICHAWGFKHTRFTIHFMEGPYGFNEARKHPEYILRNSRGQFEGFYSDARVDPLKLSIPDNPERYPWTYVMPNFWRADALEWALVDLKKGVDGFREDGVYFDGRYAPHPGYDAFGVNLVKTGDMEAVAERNMIRTREVLLGGEPRHFIWANGPNPRSGQSRLFDSPQTGLLDEIQWPFLVHPTMPCNNYRGFFEAVMSSRNLVYLPSKYVDTPSRQLFVGYLCPGWTPYPAEANRERWTMAQHVMAIVAANLGHPFAAGPQMRNFKQMMMRYSEYYWHEDVEVMKDGYKRFVCDSLREVWYDDSIYRRETPEYTDYYIHLVNVPESEMCKEAVDEDAPEVDDAEVSTKLFGPDGVKAWAIQPSGYLDAKLEPRQCEVEVKSVDGETVFAVPPFRYYTLLVVRVKK